MKIIITDNYDTGIRNDRLVAENVDEHYAHSIAAALNSLEPHITPNFFRAVPYDYVLFKFEC